MTYEKIPSFLKKLNNWVLWRLTQKPGQKKPSKVPYWANGQMRSGVQGCADDRAQFASFATVANHNDSFSGIGLAIVPDAGLIALDFDDCVIDGVITVPFVAALVSVTYCEYSPSGKGIRAFMRGKLPSKKDTAHEVFKVEVFGDSGFVTVTGNVLADCAMWGTDNTVCDVTPEVLALYAERFGAASAALHIGEIDDNDRWLLSLRPLMGWTPEHARSILMDCDADCGRPVWLKCLMAIHHESDGAEWAFNLAVEWSRTGGDKFSSESDVRGRWRSFGKGNGATMGGGWLLKYRAECLANVDRTIAKLKRLPNDDILKTWQGHALSLSRANAVTLRDWVSLFTGTQKRALDADLKDARSKAASEVKSASMARRTGSRKTIRHRPEDATQQAMQVEGLIVESARPGEYVEFAGMLSHVITKSPRHAHMIDSPDAPAPPVLQIEALNHVEILRRVEGVAVFVDVDPQGVEVPRAVPQTITNILLDKSNHCVPKVTGIATHPIVMRDGSIHAADGLHSATGLFFSSASVAGARAYGQQDAREALARLRAAIGDGFEFASALDLDIAVAALLTGLQRRTLDQSPGLAVMASTQASGKTTLPRRIHVVLTGQDMPVSAFNDDSDEAMTKRLIASLLNNPAMICYDNIKDGFTFRSAPVATAMTSAVFTDRLLGVSKMVECPTNTLFVITGNNLSLGADEVTRWMVCRLAPKSARPEKRVFKNPDVVMHALSIRDAVLRDAVGIIAGYRVFAADTITSGARYHQWDSMVRQPLMWAGGMDVAAVFDQNDEQSEENNAHRGLLLCLRDEFPVDLFTGEMQWFRAIDVVNKVTGYFCQRENNLSECLQNLRVLKVQDSRSVGHCLRSKVGRVASINGLELVLQSTTDKNGIMKYRVRG